MSDNEFDKNLWDLDLNNYDNIEKNTSTKSLEKSLDCNSNNKENYDEFASLEDSLFDEISPNFDYNDTEIVTNVITDDLELRKMGYLDSSISSSPSIITNKFQPTNAVINLDSSSDEGKR